MATDDYSVGNDGSARAQRGVNHAQGNGPIHIKPSREGSLHTVLGVPQGDKIPASQLQPKPSDTPAVAKKKNFARNARKFNH